MAAEGMRRRVLICGHRAFAAKGLAERLIGAGHEVVRFSRGPLGAEGGCVFGPVEDLDQNPHLERPFDTVINFILLKDRPLDENLRYLVALVRFCRARSVAHLVQISSVSVYADGLGRVTERSRAEREPSRKGAYGALKVAADRVLLAHRPAAMKLSLVRPGFILGRGLADPIVGTGARLPDGRLLLLGNERNAMPLIGRDALTEALVRLVARPPEDPVEILLLVAPNSPTRRQYLDACCRRLGCGMGVRAVPVPVWLAAGVAGEAAARIVRFRAPVLRTVASACRRHRFDPSATAARLGMDLRFDWRGALRDSMDGQAPNFRLAPRIPARETPTIESVTFIGFGRIVRQRHLPAVRRLAPRAEVHAYDLAAYADAETGIQVQDLSQVEFRPKGVVVVATPGPAHAEAIGLLSTAQGPVLVEKPLGYTSEELRSWAAFAARHPAGVFACHNYRFKRNVGAMLDHLRRWNPGRMLHAHLDFQSPPVEREKAAWLRDERRARTLLMDYAVHFLDLACMFDEGPWRAGDVRWDLDAAGRTARIEGSLVGTEYRATFSVRQGFMPRRARLLFTFQNYSASLAFFPDTFVPIMCHDNPFLHAAEAWASARATAVKASGRLAGRETDRSHEAVYRAVCCGAHGAGAPLRVERAAGFYAGLIELADRVYGADRAPAPPA